PLEWSGNPMLPRRHGPLESVETLHRPRRFRLHHVLSGRKGTRAPARARYPPNRTGPDWRKGNCGYPGNPRYIATQLEERARMECPLHTGAPLRAVQSSFEKRSLRRRGLESTPEAAGDRNGPAGIEILRARRRD